VLYVYAITGSSDEPTVPGLHGASVRAIGAQAPFAMASEHRAIASHPDEADLWAHERVVENLMDAATVLPMRFGSTIADDASLVAILEARRREFEAMIEDLQGTVELSVRAQIPTAQAAPIQPAAAPDDAGSGSAYLRRRRAAQRAADDTASRLHEPLDRLARRSARKPVGLARGVFKAAYLVDLERVEAFQTRVEDLSADIAGARIACTGPWPPYSFTCGASK
jgi:hypothetical protein